MTAIDRVPYAHALVDCDCQVKVHSDGSGVEIYYCRLHYAAPDLLAVAEWLDSFWSKEGAFRSPESTKSAAMLSPETVSLWRAARVAIAKAKDLPLPEKQAAGNGGAA